PLPDRPPPARAAARHRHRRPRARRDARPRGGGAAGRLRGPRGGRPGRRDRGLRCRRGGACARPARAARIRGMSMRTAAVVQCTFSNLLARDPTLARRAGPADALERDPGAYVVAPLRACGTFDAIVLAVPDVPENAVFRDLAAAWGCVLVAGDEYDVTAR